MARQWSVDPCSRLGFVLFPSRPCWGLPGSACLLWHVFPSKVESACMFKSPRASPPRLSATLGVWRSGKHVSAMQGLQLPSASAAGLGISVATSPELGLPNPVESWKVAIKYSRALLGENHQLLCHDRMPQKLRVRPGQLPASGAGDGPEQNCGERKQIHRGESRRESLNMEPRWMDEILRPSVPRFREQPFGPCPVSCLNQRGSHDPGVFSPHSAPKN